MKVQGVTDNLQLATGQSNNTMTKSCDTAKMKSPQKQKRLHAQDCNWKADCCVLGTQLQGWQFPAAHQANDSCILLACANKAGNHPLVEDVELVLMLALTAATVSAVATGKRASSMPAQQCN